MAILEIHDGRGGVERVTISRDRPVFFGSSPECDIVLRGAGIFPIHGRIRWKGTRYKAQASPEAAELEVNGRPVPAKRLKQGDEIRVGSCRIFLINPETGPAEEAAPAEAARATFERADLLSALELGARSSEADEEAVERKKKEAGNPVDAEYDRLLAEAMARKHARAAQSATPARPPWWQRLHATLTGRDQRPGEERILSSPVVLGLAGTLAVLAVLSLSLWGFIARTRAQQEYAQAVESFDLGEDRTAIQRFDLFLTENPNDRRVPKARVLRALASVRQFTTGAGPSWSNGLRAAREMHARFQRVAEYRDVRILLADQVLKTAEGLADRAKRSADADVLAEAESALALHAEVAGEATASQLQRSRAPAKLTEARAAVQKGQTRTRALAAMDAALKARSAPKVYDAREALVAAYPDLANDRAVVDRLKQANELIRRAVVLDASGRPGETEPREEPFGPATALVLRTGLAKPAAEGPVVYALADSFAYGLDAATGAPLWQRELGPGAPFPPVAIPGGEPAVLAFDTHHHDLVRLRGRDGRLVWRQEIGEPIADPPLVLGNQAFLATSRGNLLVLDLARGDLQATLRLGRPLTRTPVADEAGQFLYLLADQANLFVVARDPLACAAVEYLGHDAGAIPCPPARVGRYLVVVENHALDASRWRVLLIQEDGARVRQVQEIAVAGWTWATPASSGSVIWATGDRGGVTAYAIGAYDAPKPFQAIAQLAPEAESAGPTFALARTERELWRASARSGRFDLNAERGAIAAAWTLAVAGPAVGPLQADGQSVILSQQVAGRPGVALWGVDPRNGSVRWRTELGTPWTGDLTTLPRGAGLTALAPDGRTLTLTPAKLESGGFVEQPIPGPGKARLPAGSVQRLDGDGFTLLVPGARADHLLVRDGDQAEFRRVSLPAPLDAAPLLWGGDLLTPVSDGRVYLIDPKTGTARAEPLLTPFDRDHPTHWRAPVAIESDAVVLAEDGGRVRRLVSSDRPNPRMEATAEVRLDSPIVADPASTGGAVVLVTGDGRIRALAARDLSPVGAWPLAAPRALGPVAVGEYAFVADAAGGVVAFDAQGRRIWSIDLHGAPPAGPPAVIEDSAWILSRDGALHHVALADGSRRDRIALGLLPDGSPLAVGSEVVVPVAPGVVRMIGRNHGRIK